MYKIWELQNLDLSYFLTFYRLSKLSAEPNILSVSECGKFHTPHLILPRCISTLLNLTKKAKKRKIEEIIILLYFDLIKRFEEKRPKNEISHNINMHWFSR